MSLQPQSLTPIPEETIRVARAAFAKGNRYMRMRATRDFFAATSTGAKLYLCPEFKDS